MDIPKPMQIMKKPSHDSLKNKIDKSWEEAKKEYVIEKETKTKISTLTSMAWMYLSDERVHLGVKDVQSTV